MPRPNLICLTPIRNEAWILEKFLRSASLWADHIIVADQNSIDGSREIARKFDKVILIDNPHDAYDEALRQQLLIAEARRLPGPRILIALDADEFLTPDFSTGAEWKLLLEAKPGTILRFRWANIRPGFKQYWLSSSGLPLGLVDDGSEHRGEVIHSNRVPVGEHKGEILFEKLRVMHFQYAVWERMESKHRWYQTWERIKDPQRSAIDIYRLYHHMYSVPRRRLHQVPSWWFEEYAKHKIELTDLQREPYYLWDTEVLGQLSKYGTGFFSRDGIWDFDWENLAHKLGHPNPAIFRDPRGILQKILHSWFRVSQPFSNWYFIRATDRFLRILT